MLVSLGASSLSREELKKLLGRMLKNKPLMGEPEKSKLTLSIIRVSLLSVSLWLCLSVSHSSFSTQPFLIKLATCRCKPVSGS